eukprot:TRINITY_DN8068_c0_g4_i2.p1 TRINITY_DN8068_c0_g4~~TRINITY_DN8068_c0_g4_i2.p1  ORF type:complete len:492 (+),score=69.60 TRINITY_DN8068_c0_g4_i2:88-1563(+)
MKRIAEQSVLIDVLDRFVGKVFELDAIPDQKGYLSSWLDFRRLLLTNPIPYDKCYGMINDLATNHMSEVSMLRSDGRLTVEDASLNSFSIEKAHGLRSPFTSNSKFGDAFDKMNLTRECPPHFIISPLGRESTLSSVRFGSKDNTFLRWCSFLYFRSLIQDNLRFAAAQEISYLVLKLENGSIPLRRIESSFPMKQLIDHLKSVKNLLIHNASGRAHHTGFGETFTPGAQSKRKWAPAFTRFLDTYLNDAFLAGALEVLYLGLLEEYVAQLESSQRPEHPPSVETPFDEKLAQCVSEFHNLNLHVILDGPERTQLVFSPKGRRTVSDKTATLVLRNGRRAPDDSFGLCCEQSELELFEVCNGFVAILNNSALKSPMRNFSQTYQNDNSKSKAGKSSRVLRNSSDVRRMVIEGPGSATKQLSDTLTNTTKVHTHQREHSFLTFRNILGEKSMNIPPNAQKNGVKEIIISLESPPVNRCSEESLKVLPSVSLV